MPKVSGGHRQPAWRTPHSTSGSYARHLIAAEAQVELVTLLPVAGAVL
jgi:hypothetical protein